MSILYGTLCFALLLNLKHIYLYVAPVFIVWLLRSYCMNDGSFFKRLFILGGIVFITLIISFGPFVSQLSQVNNYIAYDIISFFIDYNYLR